jgi:hypothetical protein
MDLTFHGIRKPHLGLSDSDRAHLISGDFFHVLQREITEQSEAEMIGSHGMRHRSWRASDSDFLEGLPLARSIVVEDTGKRVTTASLRAAQTAQRT